MKYSYYQNKKKPPVGEVTDEEVVNIIRHDEKLAHMTLDIRQHLTANDIATADFIKDTPLRMACAAVREFFIPILD